MEFFNRVFSLRKETIIQHEYFQIQTLKFPMLKFATKGLKFDGWLCVLPKYVQILNFYNETLMSKTRLQNPITNSIRCLGKK